MHKFLAIHEFTGGSIYRINKSQPSFFVFYPQNAFLACLPMLISSVSYHGAGVLVCGRCYLGN